MNPVEPRRHLGLVVPQEKHDRLVAAASLNQRSVSGEVRAALLEHLGGRDLTKRARVFGDSEVRG